MPLQSRMSGRVIVFDKGVAQQSDTPMNIYNAPATSSLPTSSTKSISFAAQLPKDTSNSTEGRA